MIRNYFADLELGVDANLEDVRKAYKKLVRKFHPDLNPLDPYAHQSFQRIQEAYEYLNSFTRIQKLRKSLIAEGWKEFKEPSKWGEFSLVAQETKRSSDDQWREERTSFAKKKTIRREEDLDLRLHICLSEKSLDASRLTGIEYRFQRPCGFCRGVGGSARAVTTTCKSCAGIGFLVIERGAMHWKKTCDTCLGKGFEVSGPCSYCSGKGKTTDRQILNLKLPKKLNQSQPFLLKELGHIAFDGKKRGDLWLQIETKNG